MNNPLPRCNPTDTTFNGAKVIYPVKFDLKVFIKAINANETNIGLLKELLSQLPVPHSDFATNMSKTGKYVSYTTAVTIENEQLFNKLYAELTTIPHIITAI